MKHKKNTLYALNTDIEKLDARYDVLCKQVLESPNLPKEQITRECDVLLEKYNMELEDLSKLREVEYETERAKIEARNREEIPWRRCWLWRLLFQPLTNRAQDIIELEAMLNAEERFRQKERELEAREDKLYNAEGKKLSRRKRKKMFNKYLKYKHLLEETIQAADEAAPGEVFEQPEPPVVPPAEPSAAAHGASDEAHQSGDKDAKAAVDVTEPAEPAQTSKEPKSKAKRKKEKTTVPGFTAVEPAEQLPGQMQMDELTADK